MTTINPDFGAYTIINPDTTKNIVNSTSGYWIVPKKSLHGHWAEELADKGLWFYSDSLDDLFNGVFRAYLYNRDYYSATQNEQRKDSLSYRVGGDFAIYINGMIELEYRTHLVGDAKDGTLRQVYVLDIGNKANIRAGLTVHVGNGSWSSWPPHKFESEAMLAPVKPRFEELFAYVTRPSGGWGVQIINNVDDVSTELLSDREIKDIPLSSHPVVAGPGIQLAYFWGYTSNNGRQTEKIGRG